MDHLAEAFEDVADWCERHLEGERGREVGMTCGAMLQTFGRLATLPDRPEGEGRASTAGELNARAENLLLQLSIRFLAANMVESQRDRPLEATSLRTNMTYDTGPRPQE